jgi:hypothetical protein
MQQIEVTRHTGILDLAFAWTRLTYRGFCDYSINALIAKSATMLQCLDILKIYVALMFKFICICAST